MLCHKREWFSGKIQRCHRWAPSSILGWRSHASIAQLGERKTEDLKAPCSIHGRSTFAINSFYDLAHFVRGIQSFSFHSTLEINPLERASFTTGWEDGNV